MLAFVLVVLLGSRESLSEYLARYEQIIVTDSTLVDQGTSIQRINRISLSHDCYFRALDSEGEKLPA